MTTPGAATADSPSGQSDTRYRYYQQPPKTVFLKWLELADLLPSDATITEGNHEGMIVGLPAEEIFQSITPRIRLNRLAALLPDGFLKLPDEKHQEFLHIPASRIAKHYQLITLREQLAEEPKPVPLPEPKSEAPQKVESDNAVAPKAVPESEKPPIKEPDPLERPLENIIEKEVAPPVSIAKPEILPAKKPVVPPPLPPQPEAEPKNKISEPSFLPIPEKKLSDSKASEVPVADAQTPPLVPPKEESPKTAIPKPLMRAPLVLPKPPMALPPQVLQASAGINPQQKRRLFDRLPLFRKKPAIPAPGTNNPVLLQPTAEQISAKLIPPTPVAKFVTHPVPPSTTPAEKKPEPPSTIAPLSAINPPIPPAVVMEDNAAKSSTETRARSEIPDQESLQALFMTEEPLTIERTIELCSMLPGIRACILARGSGVIASANVPNGIDILNLSTNAMTMLRQMQDSLQKMGIGSIPAVTLHSEKGLVSVLPHEDMCLLVVHKDRTFIPGVRQRLLDALQHLSHANLPLAIEAAPRKPPASLY